MTISPSVGCCIYCGTTEGDLTREHVLPAGLGGSESPIGDHSAVVLRHASCESCRRVTHEFETELQTKTFVHLREYLGLAKRTSPDRVRGYYEMEDGSVQEIYGKPGEIPVCLVLPVFSRKPGILNPDQEPGDRWIGKMIHMPNHELPEGAIELQSHFDVDPINFQRLLAKIALGLAVLEFGVSNFDPVVCDFILGKEVGGHEKYVFTLKPEEEAPTNERHSTSVRIHKYRDSGIEVIVVLVRLFAYLDTPTYGVVVGTMKRPASPQPRRS